MADVLLLPARNQLIEIAEFDADVVVFDPRCKRVHLIEGLAAVVFDACDGVTTRHDLLTDMVAALDVSADEADRRVQESLDSFKVLGLLAGTEFDEPPP